MHNMDLCIYSKDQSKIIVNYICKKVIYTLHLLQYNLQNEIGK